MPMNATSGIEWATLTSPYSTTGPPPPKIPPTLDLVLFVITVIFILASVNGNIYMIWCFFKYLRKKLSKCFVIYISIMAADLIQGLFSMPFTAMIYLQTHEISEELHENRWFDIACNVSGFVYNTVSRVAVHLVFLLTVDRFLAVYQPQIHRYKTSRNLYTAIIAAIWVFDMSMSCIPYFHGMRYMFRSMTQMDSTCVYKLYDLASRGINGTSIEIENRTFQTYLWWYLGTVSIPVTLFLFLNVLLSVLLLRKLNIQLTNSQRSSKKVYVYASHTILLIVLVYFVCYFNWNIVQIFGTVQAIAGAIYGRSAMITLTNFFNGNPFLAPFFANTCIFAFANSAINPIVLYFRIVRNEMNPRKQDNQTIYTSAIQKVGFCKNCITSTFSKRRRTVNNTAYTQIDPTKEVELKTNGWSKVV